MDPSTASRLLELNRRFYDEFGDAFAATRRRIQPGVYRVLREFIPRDVPSDWLDIGCGSGALGKEWAAECRTGSYCGLDFSAPLLAEARRETAELSTNELRLTYTYADLMEPKWTDPLPPAAADGVFAFASLHHIPGRVNHERVFRQVSALLKPGGCFIFSVWQFQHSEKLMRRVQPWSLVDLNESLLEKGDTLLDWRAVMPGQPEKIGLRYVHLFGPKELDDLVKIGGFRTEAEFYSDGKEGNQALYRVCRKAA